VKGWRPENYSREYFGPVPLRKALALSLNTVSVRLTLEFGPTAVVRTAHRLGIASKLEPNASIALGTSEVSVLELVGAYATFANGGMEVMPHVVETVCAADGKPLYQHQSENLGRIVEARCPVGRPPARPAPPRISATPGSSAIPAISSPGSGSVMTTTRLPRRPPGAACRSRSGAGS
jgi:penicillin-binding protein 1A